MSTIDRNMIATLRAAHPMAELFPLLPRSELDALAADIHENGLREPVALWRGLVLDGRNRLAACARAGVEPRFRELDLPDEDAAIRYVVSANIHRRHLSESQRALVAALLATRPDGVRKGRGAPIEAPTQDEAAQRFSVSRTSVQRARVVLDRGTPELISAVAQDRAAVSDAVRVAELAPAEQREALRRVDYGEARNLRQATEQLERDRIVAKIEAEDPLAGVRGHRFRVLVVDPPWRYELRAGDTTHRGRCRYPDMSVDEICTLPVADLAEQDAVLWLWTTNVFMPDSFRVLQAWGFEHKTILTWDKQMLGLGSYLRNITEHCLVAVHGRPTLILGAQTTLISERRREHSRKPEAFYTLVESLCPGTKLEMFARTSRPGWHTTGAEL